MSRIKFPYSSWKPLVNVTEIGFAGFVVIAFGFPICDKV